MPAELIGNVSFPRALIQHEFFTGEPANRQSMFISMVGWANTKPTTITINGRSLKLKRGQLAYGNATLAERFRCSRDKVRAVLGQLQDERLIMLDISSTITVISILDYDIWNPVCNTELATDKINQNYANPATEPTTDPATEPTPETTPKPTQSLRVLGVLGVEEGGSTRPREAKKPPAQQWNSPADFEVEKFCFAFKDLARGIDGIPEMWWQHWLADAHERSAKGIPVWVEWQKQIARKFRGDWVARHPKALGKSFEDWVARHPKALGKSFEKNGGAVSSFSAVQYPADVQTILKGRSIKHALFQIQRDLEEAEGRLMFMDGGLEEPPQWLRDQFSNSGRDLKVLEKYAAEVAA